MKGVWILAMFMWPAALALSYDDALAQAESRPPVVSARAELSDAKAQLFRIEADPEAVRLDLLRARQRVALAEATLRLERVRAKAEISRAYTQLLDAASAYKVTRAARDLAERALRIARLRWAKGGISKQALREAELEYERASSAVRRADEARSLARTQLASLIGGGLLATPLEPPGEPVVPSLSTVYMSLDDHPDRLRIAQALELAELALSLLDPSYAPQAQIEAAQLQIDKAREGLLEVNRGLELQAKDRWQAVSDRNRQKALAAQRADKAKKDLDIAAKRFKSGLISEIAYLELQLTWKQSELEALTAAHAYLTAAWELAEAMAQPLEVRGER